MSSNCVWKHSNQKASTLISPLKINQSHCSQSGKSPSARITMREQRASCSCGWLLGRTNYPGYILIVSLSRVSIHKKDANWETFSLCVCISVAVSLSVSCVHTRQRRREKIERLSASDAWNSRSWLIKYTA